MAPQADHSGLQSSHWLTRLVTRCKSLGSMPLARNLGAQLSRAICTRSSTGIYWSFHLSCSRQATAQVEVADLWIVQDFLMRSLQPNLSVLHDNPVCREAQASANILFNQQDRFASAVHQ